MSNFNSFQYLKREQSATPTPSFTRPVRSFAAVPSPSAQSAPVDLQTSLERADRFGHSFERIPLFPPERENNTGLPDTLKTGIETLSGLPLDNVKVHYNSAKPDQLEASAHTQGADIYVGPGQERYLPHEAWHVVQQRQGRVRPTLQARGVAINDDQALEEEADVMGERANRMGSTRLQRETISSSRSVEKHSNLTPFTFSLVQRHHNLKYDNTSETDAQIYIIVEKKTGNVVYVGQTCNQVGYKERFKQHLREKGWSSDTHETVLKEQLKEVTQLEVTAAERYWYDHYKNLGAPLENVIKPITLATFQNYKNPQTFRGAAKNFPNGDNWKPAD
jgi:Domain of unknown function (DUF4157)